MHPIKALRRRGPVVFASAVAMAAATVSGPPAATAQQSAPATTPTPAAQPAASLIDLAGVGHGPHVVTLVTGDRVTLSPVGSGFSLDVQPARRQDGTTPVILQQSTPDGVYVLPSDALAAVQAGRLDRELFNITYLMKNGYTDDQAKQVPVIVQYPKTRSAASVRSAADALPASTPTQQLESIHGAALSVPKGQAGQFWASVRGHQASGGQFGAAALGSGVSKVWLDRKVHVTLDQSVPLVGAPQAWAAGHDGTGVSVAILDTGIDTTHPDLAGKVVASRSFVDGVDTVVDDNGHGTHVASTIAGTGAASGGKYKGVAPGARLIIGKVCDGAGRCSDSSILAGMQWAATSGAKVVNMSLGGDPSDGTDPLSQAVNELTAYTGTLFVIAAGNSGPSHETVGSPGAADAALTVAATDKSDALANFSSRGPRLDGGLKPDIAAPGVDITAARAAGTALGPIVDERYTTISGTSMATPHVTGAVAILAQEHPDWTATQLKAALMSTATDVGQTVYERGAGRLDVARASTQQVLATTPNVDFGRVLSGAPPASRQVSYTNLSDQPVTLTLATALRASSGTSADNALSLDVPTLTVPARGTATATVTLDPTDLGLGPYSGAVTAQADGIRLTTPVGVDREAPRFNLTVHTIGRDGRPVTPRAQTTLDVTGPRGLLTDTRLTEQGTTVTRVPAGKVSVAQWITWVDQDSRANLAYLLDPEVTVTGDTEITLDARTASQVTFDTPLPAEPINNTFDAYYQRTTAAGESFADHMYFDEPTGAWGKLWVTPTRPVTEGRFRFATQWTLGKSEVDLSIVRPQRQALHTVAPHHYEQTTSGTPDVDGHPDFRFVTGTQDLPVVDVGQGRPEDLAGRDLRGKLLLVEVGMATGLFGPVCGVQAEEIGPLRETGAAGLVFFPSADTSCPIPMNIVQKPLSGPFLPIGIPYTFLSTREGLALRAEATTRPVTVRVSGTPETPYTYVLKPYEEGRVSNSLHYTFGEKQLAQVDLDIHSATPTRMGEYQFAWKQDDDLLRRGTDLADNGTAYTAPRTRREWVGPLAPDVLHTRGIWSQTPLATRQSSVVYDRPVRVREQWFAGPITPGAMTYPRNVYALPDTSSLTSRQRGLDATCVVCRQGDILWPFFFMTTGSGDTRYHDNMFGYWQFQLHLDKDGVAVPEKFPGSGILAFTVNDEPGTYHLTATSPATAQNPQTDVTWTWRAGPVDEKNWQPGYLCASFAFGLSDGSCHPEPLVYVSYDLTDSLAMDNTVPAGRRHTFTVDAYHSPSQVAMPKIAGLRLWASTDDGRHWFSVSVKRDHEGTFTATTTYPKYQNTTGAVSLRAEAWDADGNRVEQTTMRAFALRDDTHHGPHKAE